MNEFDMKNDISAPTRLGKVEMSGSNRTSSKVDKDELNSQVSKTLGVIEILLNRLPTKGMFYSPDMKIYIRPATTAEIKDYSLMNENDPLDINDKINNIISSCVELRGDRFYSFKDLVEDDKMFIALSIRELTFPKGESVIKLKPLCPHCDFENQFELRTDNLQYYEENKTLSKYFNRNERCFDIATKDFGTIRLSPPKIGVMQIITDYAKNKQMNKQKWDKASIQILPYMGLSWKNLNENTIMEHLISFQGWNVERYSLIFRLVETMKSGIKQTLKFNCNSCEHELDVNVEIEGGMKTLFIPNIRIEDQLI
jgi:hypothetical protein